MFVFLYIGVILAYFLLLLFLTFGSNGWGFLSIDAIVTNLENNFLIGLFVLLPAVVVFLVSIFSKHESFAKYNWLIAVGISLVRILILLVASRWSLIRSRTLIFLSIVSVLLSYYVSKVALEDRSTLSSANPSVLIIVMWLITVLIFAKLIAEAKFGNLDEDDAYNKNIVRLYAKYSNHFNSVVSKFFKNDPVAYRLLFSIMIAEDINRPGIVRLLERMLFPFRGVATTGIMQVTSKEYLDNKRSVTLAQQFIKSSYRRNSKSIKEEYNLVRAVASAYNGGVYPELVTDIYFILKEAGFKYSTVSI